MLPGVNPRQMRQMMKKMGMQQAELEVDQVIFKMGEKELVFNSPQVSKVNMMGQDTYQLTGEPEEKSTDTTPDISEEDIQTVMDQANCSKEEAIEAIEKFKGDLAEAIMSFQ